MKLKLIAFTFMIVLTAGCDKDIDYQTLESIKGVNRDCAIHAGEARTTYAAKRIEKTCLLYYGGHKAWYEW